jgi:hypothetical protein
LRQDQPALPAHILKRLGPDTLRIELLPVVERIP